MKEITLVNEVIKILSAKEKRKLRYDSELTWLNNWEKMWMSDRIRVGVIGVTSSGKSTLINALLGDDLLSVAVRPSSSQLVSCSYAKERSATIYFLNGNKQTIVDTADLKNTIIQYSDESYNKRNEKKVAQLELSTPNFDLGEDVLLVDSPGLDASGYEMHEKLTLETLLPTVDVVILVTTVKSEVDQKMRMTLDTIARHNCPVMIIQNMLDAVRPSPDGRKSSADVARERLNRVRLAVEQSRIQNKSEVRISQISAIIAMQYRCHKDHSPELTAKFQRCRYESFVTGVKELIAAKRPEIEKQRIHTVLARMEELIKQENERTKGISTTIPADRPLHVLWKKLDDAFEQTNDDIEEVIAELQKMYSRYFDEVSENPSFFLSLYSSLAGKSLGEKEIGEIKQVVRSFETKIMNSVSNFSRGCSDITRQLNLPARDLWSYNGLPRMPDLEVKTKAVPRTRTVRKPGFGNLLLRGLTNSRYGVEEVEYTDWVTDNDATREAVKRYIQRLATEYNRTLDAWHKNARATVMTIQKEIDSRIKAIADKANQVQDVVDWQETRTALENCIRRYGGSEYKPSHSGSSFKENTEVQDGTKQVKVSSGFKGLYNAAESYLLNLQRSTLRCALSAQEREGRSVLVVSNSQDNLSDFIYRFYGVRKTYFAADRIETISNGVYAVCAPTEKQIRDLIKSQNGMNVYLLINGLQFHTEFETKLRRSVKNTLTVNDALFLVIQDFETLANGNAITECLRTVRIELKDHNGMVLISHNNPVYNMALIHAQTVGGKLREETIFYDSLTSKFPSLVNETIKKRINHILRS